MAENNTTDFKVLDISSRDFRGVPSLAIVFSHRLDPDVDPSGAIQVFPEKKNQAEPVSGSWILSGNEKELFFPYVEPDTRYQVTVTTDISSKGGKALSAPFTKKKIRTRSARPMVAFADSGMVMPKRSTTGFPIVVMNVEEVQLDIFRIRPDKMVDVLKRFQPASRNSYYSLENIQKSGTLAFSGTYQFEITKNKRETINLPLEDRAELSEPGFYFVVMRKAGDYKYRYDTTYFAVSDVGLHARLYEDRMELVASRLSDGTPETDLPLSFMDEKGSMATITTNEKGMVRLPLSKRRPKAVLAVDAERAALLKLSGPALDLSEFALSGRRHASFDPFLYSERDIYRPGETARFSVLLRDGDGNPVPQAELFASLKTPTGATFSTRHISGNELGYYTYRQPLQENTRTGTWTFSVETPDGKTHSYKFLVEDFLPERMKLVLGKEETSPVTTRDAARSLAIEGAYLYGAPAAGNRIEGRVRIAVARNPFAAYPGFVFGLEKEVREARTARTENGVLDANGRRILPLPARLPDTWKDWNAPVSLTWNIDLFESGGRPVSRSKRFLLMPKDRMVGIRGKFDDRRNTPENRELPFELLVLDKNGEEASGGRLSVTLIKEHREYYWNYESGTGWSYHFTTHPYPVFQQDVDLKDASRTSMAVPVERGEYILKVENRENDQISEYRFHAGDGWWNESSGALTARPDRVTVELDRKSYNAGDTARVTLRAPHAGSGLLMVESGDGILWSKRISLPKEGATFEVPVNPEWNRHDLFVTCLVTQNLEGMDAEAPLRSLGIQALPLNREGRRLALSLDAPERMVPESRMSVKLNLENPPQGPVMVTLAAVDEGVLSVSNFKTPDPFAHYFDPRRFTPQLYDNYGQVIRNQDGTRARLRFGGGAGELSRGGKQAKSEVTIISLFSGPVTFTEDGSATIHFEVPDFNGTLRLMAVAFGKKTFGSTEKNVLVRSPVVAEISMPRFIACGDESRIAFDLTNMEDNERRFALSLSFMGNLTSFTPIPRELTLPPKEKRTVSVPVTAGLLPGKAEIRLRVKSLDADLPLHLERKWSIALRSPFPARTETLTGVVAAGEKKTFRFATDELVPTTMEGELAISSLPPLGLAEHLDRLLGYPYGCLEQTTSKAFPLLWADDATLKRLGLKLPGDLDRVAAIDTAISRIASMQRKNGGFALWDASGPEEQWLSVYAMEFLLAARDAGFAVDDKLLSDGFHRLKQFASGRHVAQLRYSEDSEHYEASYEAYAVFILARENRIPLSRVRSWQDRISRNAKGPLPLLHLGLALKRLGDHRRGDAMIEKALQKNRSRRYLGEYGSEIRDVALMNALLEEAEIPLADGAQSLMRLGRLLREQRWLSTQERVSLFRLARTLGDEAAPMNANVSIAGNAFTATRGSYSRRLPHVVLRSSISIEATDKPVYYRIAYNGTRRLPAPFEASGMKIEKRFFDDKGNPIDTLDEIPQGALVIVKLDVEADTRMPDALVVDLLPAGFEIENPRLAHSASWNDYAVGGVAIGKWLEESKIAYTDYLDDRFVTALFLNEKSPRTLYYLLRAVTPGTYRVPAPFAEDMYRTHLRAVGTPPVEKATILP